MVAGLAFLSKKSWHTKNFANQERVWLAEERKKAEDVKTKELAKQIKQEHEEEELNRITGKKAKIDRGIDWMYQGHHRESEIAKEDAAKQSEEYLLGKEFVGDGAVKGDLDDGKAYEGVNAVVAVAASRAEAGKIAADDSSVAEALPSVHDRNEAFRVRHEDPMFAITMKAVDNQHKYEKKKELYERVTGETAVAVDASKEETKPRKKESKSKKKSKKHRSEDDDSSSSYYERKRCRSRDHKKRRREKKSRRRYSSSSSRSRSRSRSNSRDREHASRRKDICRRREEYDDHQGREFSHRRNYRNERDGLYVSGSSDRDRDRYAGRRNDEDRGRGAGGNRERCWDAEHAPRESTGQGDRERSTIRDAGYGLQGQHKRDILKADLGPDRDLLKKRREERTSQRDTRRGGGNTGNRKMTPAERASALRAMEADANRREERISDLVANRSAEKEEKNSRRSASFLQGISQQTHGIQGTQASLSERVRQNRTTNQRSHESFL